MTTTENASTVTAVARVEQAHTDLTIDAGQSKFTPIQVASLVQLGVADATPADLDVFFHRCVSTGLDPFARQIYMIGRKQWDPVTRENTVKQTIQTGIDGFRLIARRAADRTRGTYSISDTLWCGTNGVWHDVWLGPGQPSAAKVIVYRDGQSFPAVAHFTEYAGTKSGGELTKMWTKGAMMLGKCVEALALRKAYPQDLAGLYTSDEMSAADNEPAQRPQRTQHAQPAVQPADDLVTGEIVYAEVLDADSATAPITASQWTEMMRLLVEQGLGEKVDALACLSDILDRDVTGSRTLTQDEASKVIDKLTMNAEGPWTAEPPVDDAA